MKQRRPEEELGDRLVGNPSIRAAQTAHTVRPIADRAPSRATNDARPSQQARYASEGALGEPAARYSRPATLSPGVYSHEAFFGASPLQLKALDTALVQFRVNALARSGYGIQDDAEGPRTASEGANHARAVAMTPLSGSGGPLPYLDKIQSAFGHHDVSHVRSYDGASANEATATLNAKAYATGGSVVLGPNTNLHTVAHEAAHVIQQHAGVTLKDGFGRAGDIYEQHADAVADAVVAGRSAVGLLDTMAGSGKHAAASGRNIQLDGNHANDEDEDEDELPERMRRADRRRRHQDGRVEQQDVYLGTDTGVVDDNGEAQRRQVGGSDDEGTTQLGRRRSIRGGTTSVRGRDAQNRETQVDIVDSEERTPGSSTTRRGAQARRLDSRAMARDLRGQLEDRIEEERAQGPEDSPEIRAMQRDRAALAEVGPDDGTDQVEAIARRHRALVRPQYRVVDGDLRENSRGVDAAAARRGRVRHVDRDVRTGSFEGNSRIETNEASTEVDVAQGSVARSREHIDRVEREDGSAEEIRNVNTNSTSIGQGVRHNRSATRTEESTAEDGSTETREQRRQRRGGIVADSDGWGATLGGTNTDTESQREAGEEDPESGRSRSRSVDLTLRENSVAVVRADEDTLTQGAQTYGMRRSGDGSFTIDIERQNSETPPTYQLVFTIHVGLAGRVSANHGSSSRNGVRAGVNAGGGVGGDMVFRRTLSQELARQYWTAAEQHDRDPDSDVNDNLPEFGRLARIRAGADNADQMGNATAVAGDASAARQMVDGEEVELTLTGETTVGGNLGHHGQGHDVGVDAERHDEWTRRVLVTRTGEGSDARVNVTVTFTHSDRWHVQGQASAGGSPTVGARRGGNSGNGDTVRFILNPADEAFDRHYQEICHTTGRDAVRALAEQPEYQSEVDYTEHTESDGTEESESVRGAGGMGAAQRRRGSYSETIRRGQDGSLSGEVDGSQDTSLVIGSEETTLAQGGTEGSISSTVERDGQVDITAQRRTHESDIGRTAARAAAAVEGADAEERARQALGATPLTRLRRLLDSEHQVLDGFHLDEADIEGVVARAENSSRWEQCASSPRMLEEWRRLRNELRRPSIRREEREIDAVVARRLAIARHLARFYQSRGDLAQEAMHNVLTNYGAAGLSGVTRDSDAEQLGSEFEWPHGLRSQQPRYETLRGQVRDLERALRGSSTQDSDVGDQSGHERYTRARHLHEQLTSIYTRVASNNDFASESGRAGLMRHIDGYRTRLRRILATQRSLGQAEENRENESVEGDLSERGQANVERQVAQAQVRSITQRLRSFKAREQTSLRRANRLSYSWSDRDDATTICRQLHRMHLTWQREVTDLRRAYRTLGTEPSQWHVSSGPNQDRSRELEPEAGWLIEIWLRCHHNNSVDNGEQIGAQWRSSFDNY